MTLSIVFIIIDLLSVTPVIPIGVINPFWKLAFISKCLTDTIVLDDFKTALDKLSRHRRSQLLPFDALMSKQWLSGGPIIDQERASPSSKPNKPFVEHIEQIEVDSLQVTATVISLPSATWSTSSKPRIKANLSC